MLNVFKTTVASAEDCVNQKFEHVQVIEISMSWEYCEGQPFMFEGYVTPRGEKLSDPGLTVIL
jgi:hypothetical protein